MNTTPHANRKHIALTGKTNAGKSSLFNAILGQEAALVSPIAGTTADSVSKAMELLPYGPVVLVDTAGSDDVTQLGALRQASANKAVETADLVITIVDATQEIPHNLPSESDTIVFTKSDLLSLSQKEELTTRFPQAHFVSVDNKQSIEQFKAALVTLLGKTEEEPSLLKGIVPAGGVVVMVTPIDSAAPKGRLILPQVQLIRDALDNHIRVVVVRETELDQTLRELPNTALVVTDSQLFALVDKIVGNRYPLTGFSILFARQKGEFDYMIESTKVIGMLKENDHILIAETCTHTTTHEDIGQIKLPALLRKQAGVHLNIDFITGKSYPSDLSKYRLIIHCGGCMITRQTMKSRTETARLANIPLTNYGMALAFLTGIFDKSTEISPLI